MHKIATLVRMANDITNFFKVQGEERAVAGIADHIKKFWEAGMKKAIFAHIDAGGEGLHPYALAALRKLQEGQKSAVNATTPPLKPKSSNGSRAKSAAR